MAIKKTQYNALEDLATLTTIPNNSLSKLFEKLIWVICNDVEEAKINKENIIEIKIGIGSLLVGIEEDNVKYKFIPNNLLESTIIDTIKNGKNPLIINLEETFASRIVNTYKDMF